MTKLQKCAKEDNFNESRIYSYILNENFINKLKIHIENLLKITSASIFKVILQKLRNSDKVLLNGDRLFPNYYGTTPEFIIIMNNLKNDLYAFYDNYIS